MSHCHVIIHEIQPSFTLTAPESKMRSRRLSAMETTSFCSCYRVAYSSRLPPACTVANPFSFSASLNPKPLLSNLRNGRSWASSKTTTSSSASSYPMMRITCGGAVREINHTEFPDVVLTSARPVLVEFIATWCGPCRLIAPAVESIAQEYNDKLTVVKIDHDSNPGLIEEYKVYGLPTLILFKNGKEVPESRREGAITQAKLKEYIDSLLESLTVA